MKTFLTDSTEHLRGSLVKHGCSIGRYTTFAFSDGERGYRLTDDVAGRSAAIVASVLPPPESLFDLLALHRLLRENGAIEIALVLPYLGYARQDRPTSPGEAAIGGMVAELLRRTGASRLIVCDVHSNLIRSALGPSAEEISALSLFAAALAKRPPEVIVAPDAGAVTRAQQLAELLKPRPAVASIDKVRLRPNVARAERLWGDVGKKNVLIIDDMLDTGGTLAEAAMLVFENGAANIRLAATHGIFSDDAHERLLRLPITSMLLTNTLPQIRHPKIRRLDIVPLLLDTLLKKASTEPAVSGERRINNDVPEGAQQPLRETYRAQLPPRAD